MGNMSYCRFENTYNDLRDCNNHMSDTNLSDSEKEHRDKIIELCISIASDYGDDFGKEVIDVEE